MSKKLHKEIYGTDEEVIQLLSRVSLQKQPSEDSLRSLLRAIPEAIPSPYVSKTGFFFSSSKVAVAVFAVVLLVSGGTVFVRSTQVKPSAGVVADANPLGVYKPSADTSDDDLDNDVSTIDAQMDSLDVDTAYIE